MGIPLLREPIEACEEIVPIAQLAEEHYKEYKRPLKIAVDQADWQFHNVTPEKVATIRKYKPDACPIQKAIFHRICKLLTLNIRIVIVFDGDDVPPKRNRPPRPKHKEERDREREERDREREILIKILKGLGVAYIKAPGEAEAECCRLQRLKLVDAVWSQDSDCLMFGCTLWLRDYRVAKDASNKSRSNADTEKDEKMVRVVRANNLKDIKRLDSDGCVLFAMLAGGDYNPGLPGCGATNALKAAQAGLGRSLCTKQNQKECDQWTAQVLGTFFKRNSINIDVSRTPLQFKYLRLYNAPTTHSDADLRAHSGRYSNYNQPPRELQLFKVTSRHLNIWWDRYLNKVGPVLLSRFLSERDESLEREVVHNIKLVKTRSKPAEDGSRPTSLERKLTFSPCGVSVLGREGYQKFEITRAKVIPPLLDPMHRVECEMPAFLLSRVLPAEVLDPPTPVSKKQAPKRKRQADLQEDIDSVPSAKKNQQPRQSNSETSQRPARGISDDRSVLPHVSHTGHTGDIFDLLDSDDDLELPRPPLRTPKVNANQTAISLSRSPYEPNGFKNDLLDLTIGEDSELKEAIRRSLEDQSNKNVKSWGEHNSTLVQTRTPSGLMPPMASSSSAKSVFQTQAQGHASNKLKKAVIPVGKAGDCDYIDLTED